MSTLTQSDGGPGYTISFTSEDLSSIHGNGRTGKANMRQIRALVGGKVMRVILPAFHNVPHDTLEEALRHVEVIRVGLLSSKQKNVGQLIEIFYRFTKPMSTGSYRHVFHFVSTNGGLSGKLFTQTRRFIAK